LTSLISLSLVAGCTCSVTSRTSRSWSVVETGLSAGRCRVLTTSARMLNVNPRRWPSYRSAPVCIYWLTSQQLKPRPDMQPVAVQLVACSGELYCLYCLGNKLLQVEHVQHCATCRQVRLFVAQTGNLLRRQVAHSVQTCNLLPATSCMSGRGLTLTSSVYPRIVLSPGDKIYLMICRRTIARQKIRYLKMIIRDMS